MGGHRRLGSALFECVGSIDAARDEEGAIILDHPHERFTNSRGLRLNAYGAGPFARLKVPLPPAGPGAYALFDRDGQLLYIGRARDSLAKRWGRGGYLVIDPRNCFVGGQSTNCRINSLITRALLAGEVVTLWAHSTSDPTALEAELIAQLQPPWNLRR